MAITPKENSKHATTRESLLRAAQMVVARDGVSRLTLDMVAQQAGISKGGILYHFPTKNALIVAMMERDMAHWKEAVTACRDAEIATGDSPEEGRWVRAFLSAAAGACENKSHACGHFFEIEEDKADWFVRVQDMRAGMIAAVANDPTLLKRIRDESAAWQNLLENDGLDPVIANIIRVTADGFFFTDMLGLAPPQGEMRRQMLEKLLELATPKKNTDFPS